MPFAKRQILTAEFFGAILAIFLCAGAISHAQTASQKKPFTLADPTIFAQNGTYYLYGTSSPRGFQVFTSRDLKNWSEALGKRDGYALRKGDSYGGGGFWAPQIFRHRNKFYMAYTADEQIAIASGDSPLGPFTQVTPRKLNGTSKQIDPFVFFDDNGKIYLFHVRLDGGNFIYVAEMKPDFSDIKPETLRRCLTLDYDWEKKMGTVMEGPTVLKISGNYFLFYSANDYRSIDYAVGYATAKSPLGPWEKPQKTPLISREILGENGTGHGDFFRDNTGAWRYVFHTHASNSAVSPRRTAIITFQFKKDAAGKMTPVPDKKTFTFLEH